MKRAVVCAGLIIAVSGNVVAHEAKKMPVSSLVEKICSDRTSAKAKQLDCKSTGTVDASKQSPKRDSKNQPEPRLGYRGNPWFTGDF